MRLQRRCYRETICHGSGPGKPLLPPSALCYRDGMNPRVLVLCVASAFFPVAASADNAKLTPAKEADIRRLLEITGAAKLAKQIMNEMRTNIRPLVMKALPPGAYRERLVNLFFERFQSKMDAEKLVGLSVPLYDKYFTHEEIKGLVAF